MQTVAKKEDDTARVNRRRTVNPEEDADGDKKKTTESEQKTQNRF